MAEQPDNSIHLDESEERRRDRRAVAAIPAIYVDTWFLTTWREHIRITFGETFSRLDDQYRSAIVMELKDAEQMATSILEMIAKRKAKTKIQEGDD
jgi:hypothetical protein